MQLVTLTSKRNRALQKYVAVYAIKRDWHREFDKYRVSQNRMARCQEITELSSRMGLS